VRNADVLMTVGHLLGRSAKAETVLTLAQNLAGHFAELPDDQLAKHHGVNQTVEALATLVDGVSGEEPVMTGAGVSRVAARFTGTSVDLHNKLTDGRLAIARMIGIGRSSKSAQLALIELAADVCTPERPQCSTCPLAQMCVTGRTRVEITD